MVTENLKNKNKPVKVITLKHPYNFGSKQITQCIFERRPKAKDLKGLSLAKQLADDQFVLLGRVTNLSTPEIEEMDMEDAMVCMEAITDFLPDSLKPGKAS